MDNLNDAIASLLDGLLVFFYRRFARGLWKDDFFWYSKLFRLFRRLDFDVRGEYESELLDEPGNTFLLWAPLESIEK